MTTHRSWIRTQISLATHTVAARAEGGLPGPACPATVCPLSCTLFFHKTLTLTVAVIVAVYGWTCVPAASAATLTESIHAALAHNPGLQGARARVEAARAAQVTARAHYWPTLVAGANYSLTDNPTQAFMMALNRRAFDLGDPNLDFNNPDDTDHLRLTAGLRYPLFDPQRRTAQTVSRHGVTAEQFATAAYQNTLIYKVKEGYYRALQARDHVQVQDDRITGLQESLRVARERFDAGTVIVTDVLNLEVQVAQAREELIRAWHGFELALAALNTAIGVDLVTAETLTAPETTIPTLPTTDRRGVKRHPELQAIAALLDIRQAEIRDARAAYAPTVSAFGSVDWDSDVSSDFERSYLVGVMAEWELFDGFRRRGQLRQARAQQAAARAKWDQARRELQLALQQAQIQAKEAYERLEVTRAAAASAAQALTLTRDQYVQGAATLADVLTAQSGFTSMQTRRTSAFYDHLTALANVERAQGQLIDRYREENTP